MAKEKTQIEEQQKELIQKAMDCLKNYEDVHSDNIQRAKDAINFRAGEQWPDIIRRDREDEHQEGGPRPCPVLDKTNQYVRQVVNEERQNRAAIRIRPVDDEADPDVAEIFNGIIRHIEDQSEAVEAYTTGGEHAIDGGFGYWRVLADYLDPMSFDQDIRIKRIPNRFSVALGPHTEVDGSDATEGLIWEDISKKEFKEKYPKAKETDFIAGQDSADWATKDNIRIAEYFYIEHETITIHLMDDGSVITDETLKDLIQRIEMHNAQLAAAPAEMMPTTDPVTGQQIMVEAPRPEPVALPEPKDSRDTLKKKVKWCKLTAAEILEERDIVGQYIPIIKVIGNELIMPDGKSRLSGMIEDMADSQRLHNYAHAGFIEDVALAPRSPWLAEESTIEGYEQDYADANRKPIAVLKYKAMASEDGTPLPPPSRIPKAGLDSAWQQMLANTEHGVAAAVGMMAPNAMEAARGVQYQNLSGIALDKQESKGMTVNYHFPDNLARSIQHTGRILLEWIPEYYDTPRVVRIIGEDGEEDRIKINPNQKMPVAKEMNEYEKEIGKIYNLAVGKYDVTVSTGPSYSAKRQEAVDTQTRMVEARPELMPIIGDILFSNMDAPGSEEIAERLKTLLPQEIKDMEAAEDAGQDPEVVKAMAQVQQAAQQIEAKGAELAKAEAFLNEEAAKTSADKTMIDSARKELAADRKVFMAEVKRQMSEIQLLGEKLRNDMENATDPLVEQLKCSQKAAMEPAAEGEAEIAAEENTQAQAIQTGIEALAEYQASAALHLQEQISKSVAEMAAMLNKPRMTEIQYDEQGNPIGSISRLQ